MTMRELLVEEGEVGVDKGKDEGEEEMDISFKFCSCESEEC